MQIIGKDTHNQYTAGNNNATLILFILFSSLSSNNKVAVSPNVGINIIGT